MRVDRPTHRPIRLRRRGILAAVLGAALLATGLTGTAAASHPAADPSVITDWNATAVATIVTEAGINNATTFHWFAIEQAAVYNAVVGITRKYDLYKWHAHAARGASPEAAAATAAYRVLLNYFPLSKVNLDKAYAASLAKIPDGRAEDRGIQFGERAAARIIKLRMNDGWNAPIAYTKPPAPGVWRPTLPGNAPMLAPWMGQVRPFVLRSTTQFSPHGPPALTSDKYTREFNEVKEIGSLNSAKRTALQTETARFISGIATGPLQASLRDLVTRRHFDISKSARLFAAVDMSVADAVGLAWYTKLHFAYWRPITAIQLADTDGNPATVADPTWQPLLVTPPYPEYVSGFNSVMGSATRALTRVLGTSRIDLNIYSPVTDTTRHYEWASQLTRDGVDGRIWSGIHFRTADVVALKMGQQVADYALERYFERHHHGHH
jgi:hypothetical protein